ncbi:MAG: signal peptide peptidase-domain-containing protein [Piptocephalis tieghemiana]|nr:MAG: signal peptide peptidase-domain-containing protein [Piptocephalis tieghemiana]
METGLITAYCALGTMALIPIYYGSYGSLKTPKAVRLARKSAKKATKKDQEEEDWSSEEEEEESEAISSEDAYWFPVVGSGALFGLYLLFRYLNKEYVNYLLTAYFALVGVAALTKVGANTVAGLTGYREHGYHIRLTQRAKELFHLRFTRLHMASAVASVLGTAYYVLTKNWIMSNAFGMAFATSAISLIELDSFKTGMILLSGLFFYDIFWVFGTEVMVSVAKNFDAPIKVIFPRNLFASKLQFTMLGLGDIVIPGIFLALALRYDQHRANLTTKTTSFPKPYFTATLIAYILGLSTTMVVMHVFQAAQPALLYLSPACIISVLLTAVVRGELSEVLSYTAEEKKPKDKKDNESSEEEDEEEESANSTATPKSSSSSKKRSGKKGKRTGQ